MRCVVCCVLCIIGCAVVTMLCIDYYYWCGVKHLFVACCAYLCSHLYHPTSIRLNHIPIDRNENSCVRPQLIVIILCSNLCIRSIQFSNKFSHFGCYSVWSLNSESSNSDSFHALEGVIRIWIPWKCHFIQIRFNAMEIKKNSIKPNH